MTRRMLMLMRNLEVKVPGSRGHLHIASAKVRLVQSRNSDDDDDGDDDDGKLTMMMMMIMMAFDNDDDDDQLVKTTGNQ